jgi:hypothetical protein
MDKINLFTWLASILIILEGILLLINKWRCPFTDIAGKYSDKQIVGFDIFLPKWLAKNNKIIFTILYVVGTLLVIYRFLG